MLHVLLLGIFVGVGACLAPGPINLEIVRRSIVRGPFIGLLFGMGALSADLMFLLLAMAGAGVLWSGIPDWGKAILCVVGAMLLCVLGMRNLMNKKKSRQEVHVVDSDADEDVSGWRRYFKWKIYKNYVIAFALTAASPSTIAFWIVIAVSVVGIGRSGNWFVVMFPFLTGVLVSFSLWLCALTFLSGSLKKVLDNSHFVMIDRFVGCILLIFGICTGYNGYAIYTVGTSDSSENSQMALVRGIGERAGVSLDLHTPKTK